MNSKNTHEARQSLKDKTIMNNNDYLLDDEVDDEMDEEEAIGGGNGYDEKKKGLMVYGRKGGSSGGVSPPSCQVERCGAHLGEAKRYHRRHKVCELHAKAQAVLIAGSRQRFCQQCSRFHELSEFDEAKRSCRRRLAGHNERRRKNTTESHGEAPGGRKGGLGTPTKENQCRNADERSKFQSQMTLPANPPYNYKRSLIEY